MIFIKISLSILIIFFILVFLSLLHMFVFYVLDINSLTIFKNKNKRKLEKRALTEFICFDKKKYCENFRLSLCMKSYLSIMLNKEFNYLKSWSMNYSMIPYIDYKYNKIRRMLLIDKLKETIGDDYNKPENCFLLISYCLNFKDNINYNDLYKKLEKNNRIRSENERFIDLNNIINEYFITDFKYENNGKVISFENPKIKETIINEIKYISIDDYKFIANLEEGYDFKMFHESISKNDFKHLEICCLDVKHEIKKYYVVLNYVQ